MPSVTEKTLRTLPELNEKLRAGFRAAFTDEQCFAWGKRCRAADIIREAQPWVVTMAVALKREKGVNYSQRRLTWLAELLVALEKEVAATVDPERGDRLSARSAALENALAVRRTLISQLRGVIGQQKAWLLRLKATRLRNSIVPRYVFDSLSATLALAEALSKDKVLAPLLDDIGVTDASLASARAALSELQDTSTATLAMAGRPGDAPSVNLLEGRVLRELRLAQQMFDEARKKGVSVPSLRAGPKLKAVFQTRKRGARAPETV